MIAIANVLFQCVIYQGMQGLFKIFHSAKVKSLPGMPGGFYSFILNLSDGLEAECLDKIFTRHCFHKNSRAIISGFCLERTYTKLTAILIAFVLYFKSFHLIVIKKIF